MLRADLELTPPGPVAPARRSRAFRPSAEALDERVVPTSLVAYGTDLFGIAGGGTVWRDAANGGWQQVGTLTGATHLLVTSNGGQEQVFAQTAGGAVSLYVVGAATPAWQPLGGAFFPGTMVATNNGVSGVAGGQSVWHYDTTNGWSRDGALAGAVALVPSTVPGTATIGQGLPEGLYAGTSDLAVWYYSDATGLWTNTGLHMFPGSLTAIPRGVAGLVAGGAAWTFTASTRAWAPAAGLSGLVSLANDSSTGELLGVEPDASVWSYNYGATATPWTNTGAFLLPGSIVDADGVLLGVGGGGTVYQRYSGAWHPIPGLTGAVAVAVAGTPSAPLIYAQRGDHVVWVRVGNTWKNTGGSLF